MTEPGFYFDTDHLNRAGLTEFFGQHLKAVLLFAGWHQLARGRADVGST